MGREQMADLLLEGFLLDVKTGRLRNSAGAYIDGFGFLARPRGARAGRKKKKRKRQQAAATGAAGRSHRRGRLQAE